MTQTTLSTLSGIEQPRLSRLINSVSPSTVDDLQGLLSAFPDPLARYRIALAHLADLLPSELFNELEITLKKNQLREQKVTLNFDVLSPEAIAAIDFLLTRLPENPAIADVLIDLATALGWKPNSSTSDGPSPDFVERAALAALDEAERHERSNYAKKPAKKPAAKPRKADGTA